MGINAKDVKELRERTGAPMMECKSALEAAGGDMDQGAKILRERGQAKTAKRGDRETKEGLVRARVGPGNQGAAAVLLSCETDFTARNEAFQKLADSALEAAWSLKGEATPEAVLDATVGGKTVRAKFEDVANTIRENMVVRQAIRWTGTCGEYTHFDGRSAAVVEVDGGDSSPGLAKLLKDVCMHVVSTSPAPLAVDAAGVPPEVIEQEKEIFVKQAMDSGKPKEIAEKMVAGRLKKMLSERALLEQPFVKNMDQTIAAYLAQAAKGLGLPNLRIKRFERLKIGE